MAALKKEGDVALDAAAAQAPGNERENGGEDAAEEDQGDAEFDWHGGCYQREGKTEGEEEFHIFLGGLFFVFGGLRGIARNQKLDVARKRPMLLFTAFQGGGEKRAGHRDRALFGFFLCVFPHTCDAESMKIGQWGQDLMFTKSCFFSYLV